MQYRMMRVVCAVTWLMAGQAPTATSGNAVAPTPGAAAAGQRGHVVTEGQPLVQELDKPQYSASRCLLSPVLAANGRAVVKSTDASLLPGDDIVAVDGERLDGPVHKTLIDLLEGIKPDAKVTLRLVRSGSERDVHLQCTDSKRFYAALRAAAQAAAADDARGCVESLDNAARLHGLSAIWLRLAMSCRIEAGSLSGEKIWSAEYELVSQRIAEARYSPAILMHLRHAVGSAARELESHGSAELGEKLRRQYADAQSATAAAKGSKGVLEPTDD